MRLSAGVVTVVGIVAVSFVAADSKELMSAQQDQMIWRAFELSALEDERRESELLDPREERRVSLRILLQPQDSFEAGARRNRILPQ